MKKFIPILLLALLAYPAFAQMDNRPYSLTVIGAAVGSTNQATYTIRGELEAIAITRPSGGTATVTVATSDKTIFTLANTAASAVYHPRAIVHGVTGAAMSQVIGTDTNTVIATKIPLYGPVTVKVVGETATTTNTWGVNLIYKR